MTSYQEDERSVSSSRPIELYTIATTSATYRLTSHPVDVMFGGEPFLATTITRGNLQLAEDAAGRELTISLPIDHPVVQRYAATGIPEQSVLVTYHRLQERSGVAIQQWQGFGCGLSVEGNLATIRVPALTDDAMRVRLPTLEASRLCPHTLFNPRCSVNIAGVEISGPLIADFTVITTVVSHVDNQLIVADMGGHPDRWATHGYIEMANGTRREIFEQVDNTLTLHAPFVPSDMSALVKVVAGCNKTIDTCVDKFNNDLNFGGFPLLNNAIDLWAPKGLGVLQQV
jgi:uncharacterized phage protein (TIGR02218 family)